MKRYKILTIDDEPGFAALIKNYFSLRGYDVYTALYGEAGLEVVQTRFPDVVFLDVKLPYLDGYQVLKRIKAIHPDAKVIMITAYKDTESVRENLHKEDGIFAYFEKPIVSFKKLEEVVNKAMEN